MQRRRKNLFPWSSFFVVKFIKNKDALIKETKKSSRPSSSPSVSQEKKRTRLDEVVKNVPVTPSFDDIE